MPLDPLNIGPLVDAQNRFKRDFIDFARLWQDAKENWRDDRARRFEQEHLVSLGPCLNRFTAAVNEFADILRKAQTAVKDEGDASDQLY